MKTLFFIMTLITLSACSTFNTPNECGEKYNAHFCSDEHHGRETEGNFEVI